MKSVQNTLDERLQILLDSETHKELQSMAIAKGLKKSSLIRTILKQSISEFKNKKL